MARPHQSAGRSQREWLRRVLDAAGLSASGLARQLGKAPSTFTRFLNLPDDSAKTLHAATIEQIAAWSGMAAPGADADAAPRRNTRRFPDVEPFIGDVEDEAVAAAVVAIIGKRKDLTAWMVKAHSLEGLRIYPGDILLLDTSITPWAGDPVLAEIRGGGGRPDLVIRIYEPPYLVAATFDPAMRKPIPVDPEHVTIRGVMRHPLRALRRPPGG